MRSTLRPRSNFTQALREVIMIDIHVVLLKGRGKGIQCRWRPCHDAGHDSGVGEVP